MDGLRLRHVDVFEVGESAQQEGVAPVDARELVAELRVGHLVVVGRDVAELHLVVGHAGQSCLDGHCGFHLLLCRGLVVSSQTQHLDDIGAVGLAHALRLCVVVEVVVAGAQSHASLSDGDDVVLGVAEVSAHAYSEEHRGLAAAVQLGSQTLVFSYVLHGSHALEHGLDGLRALTVAAHGVHGQTVE